MGFFITTWWCHVVIKKIPYIWLIYHMISIVDIKMNDKAIVYNTFCCFWKWSWWWRIVPLWWCWTFTSRQEENVGNDDCRNPNFGLATKAKGLQGCGPKREEARESRQRHGKVASQKEGSLGTKTKALEGCGPRGSPGVTTHSRECKKV